MIIRRYVVPLIALAGMALGAWTVHATNEPVDPAPPVVEPARSPFEAALSASGLVEPAGEEIAIAPAVAGVTSQVFVEIGDRVEAGAPLFVVDGRALRARRPIEAARLAGARARLAAAEERLATARVRVARLEAAPRIETLPPLRAAVAVRESELQSARSRLEIVERVKNPKAVSRERLTGRRTAVKAAEAALSGARAELRLAESGTWGEDLAVARAELRVARSEVEVARADIPLAEAVIRQLEVELDRLIVRAPVAATVLDVNLRPGEFAVAGPAPEPLILLGRTDTLHVRADIDEFDAWRFQPEGETIASLRGNSDIRSTLRFVRVEPRLVPKRSLTGSGTERIDTRVLQVIYAFDPETFPARPGQQVDLYIKAKVAAGATSAGVPGTNGKSGRDARDSVGSEGR